MVCAAYWYAQYAQQRNSYMCQLRNTDQYNLRLPLGWRAALKAKATASHRSLNSLLIALIDAGMEAEGLHLEMASQDEKDRQGCNPDGLEQSTQ